MKAFSRILTTVFLSAVSLSTAFAADDLSHLPYIDASGKAGMVYADQNKGYIAKLRAVLARIKMPPGFKIDVYAIAPKARHIAVGPEGRVTFVGTIRERVWAISDSDGDKFADEVASFSPAVDFTIPNGVCFAKDGDLYIAEQNRVLVFPDAEKLHDSGELAAYEVVKQNELIPVSEESYSHSARVCVIGPDNKLYVSLGQPYNVSGRKKTKLYIKTGIGGIIRMNRDGSNREVYTTGIRNSVGMDFNPANGELWFTDNQVDGMGDDIPPGEINRQTAAGQNFGFPWYGGGSTRTHEYKLGKPPRDTIFPAVEMTAHAADLGMVFYRGKMFPEKYRGGIFSAQHGSWDRSTPVGARVMFTQINKDGSAGQTIAFAEGWIDENEQYLGRPVATAELHDGSLLVSDDLAGAVYRISYEQ